jgi:hypothetical protein
MKHFKKIFLGIFISLLVGEVFSIMVIKAPPVKVNLFDPYLGWYPRASAAGWNAESGNFVKKSKLGFHDNNIDGSTSPACTMNFFGDSMTEAFQFKSDRNFSSIVEMKLSGSSKCKDFRVNNFGLSATGTLQQTRVMEIYGDKFPAQETALFLFLGNDLANNIYSKNEPYRPGYVERNGTPSIVEPDHRNSYSQIKNLVLTLSNYSNLARLLIASTIALNYEFTLVDDQNKQSNLSKMGIQVTNQSLEFHLKALEKSIDTLVAVSKKQNTALTIFLIPTGQEVTFGDSDLVIEIKKDVITHCKKLSILCIDILPKMYQSKGISNMSPYHLNGAGHLNLKGHQIISKILLANYTN